MLDNKIILITGGTGSFGSTFLSKITKYNPKEIRILSRDEKKQDDLRKKFSDTRIKFFIGDVRDINSIKYAIRGCDYIFHAAALKQVPSCEFFPIEAVKTNVNGTYNVVSTAIRYKVDKVVCLSTDKACYPINAMGISKAMMEKVALAESRNSDHTKVCVTRYGNVMASRGSVIPLFIHQLKNNKPLTITSSEMTRFLMSLDEAVELVLYALENGNNGDLYVQKSPASSVGDLASAVIKLFNSKSEITNIGIRHGEKLHETLLTSEEFGKSEEFDNYFKVPLDSRDLNYNVNSKVKNEIKLDNDYNSFKTKQLNVDEIISKLLELSYIQDLINK
jgi:UDP-N-acetylglucosamine 4,6-dehydratase/5-epimerase